MRMIHHLRSISLINCQQPPIVDHFMLIFKIENLSALCPVCVRIESSGLDQFVGKWFAIEETSEEKISMQETIAFQCKRPSSREASIWPIHGRAWSLFGEAFKFTNLIKQKIEILNHFRA